jgi:hypothetical protein
MHNYQLPPGEAGAVCTFETVAGERFSLLASVAQVQVARPAMSEEVEAEVKEMLKEILDEEGGL